MGPSPDPDPTMQSSSSSQFIMFPGMIKKSLMCFELKDQEHLFLGTGIE